jgi:hypothetical protein
LRTQEKSSNLANSRFFRKVREQFGWRTVRHTSRHNHNKFEIILFCLFHNIRSLVDAPSFGRPGRRRACNIFKENQQLQTSLPNTHRQRANGHKQDRRKVAKDLYKRCAIVHHNERERDTKTINGAILAKRVKREIFVI